MRTVDLIHRKRDGEELSADEIAFLVDGYTSGTIPDYQLSAFLMAVFFSGMTDREVSALTDRMVQSGETVDLSSIPGMKVDKHSTGGVGDKTSLIAAPLAAAAGVVVPMISGRALGHTGGTLDKLESIPGFRTNLTVDEFREQLLKHKLAFIGPDAAGGPGGRQTVRAARCHGHGGIHPADRVVHHVEEAGRGRGRPGARRQGRRGRVHEAAGGRAAAGADDGGHRPPRRQARAGADHRYESAAGLRHRQRAGSDGSFANAAERRADGSDAAVARTGLAHDLSGQDHDDARRSARVRADANCWMARATGS